MTWIRSLGWEDPLSRKWQPTPVFLSGEFHGQRSLVDYTVNGVTESRTCLSTQKEAVKLKDWLLSVITSVSTDGRSLSAFVNKQ